ncbi:MAG: hypothetical protein U1B78_04730, partial [Dehalococcoidia bacterium]|nr:hypothetical protein [Dehalococcoidia bacterium]
QDARDTEEGPIVPPDLPMRVPLSPEEVRSADREELRALILDGAAARVHDEGVAVLHEGGAADIGVLSTQGALRNGMDFFRPTPHRVLTGLTIAFASTAGLLALGLMLTSRGYGRLVALGASVLVAAAPFLIAAVAVRFAFRVGADGADEYASHEFLELGQELTWALIRNGIIFTVGSAAVFATGIILARWSAGVRRA